MAGSSSLIDKKTVLLGTAVVVFLLDHLVKSLIISHIALGDQFPKDGPVTLHYIQNQGAAFGLFPQLQVLYLLFGIVVSLIILVMGWKSTNKLSTQIILGLILGGGVANAFDRLRQSYVVDYIDLHRWPIFNLADMCIVSGVCLALLTFGRAHDTA